MSDAVLEVLQHVRRESLRRREVFHVVLRAVVAGVMVAVVVGCGGSTTDDGAGSDTVPGSVEPTDAVPDTVADEVTALDTVADEVTALDTVADEVTALDIDPCELLTVAEVVASTGFEVSTTISEPPLGCRFELDTDADVHIWVAVDDGRGRLAGPAAVYADYSSRLGDGDAEVVDDLGEDAVFDSGFRGLAVDAGAGRYFVVAVGGGFGALDEPREPLVELAHAALDRLPAR